MSSQIESTLVKQQFMAFSRRNNSLGFISGLVPRVLRGYSLYKYSNQLRFMIYFTANSDARAVYDFSRSECNGGRA